MGLDVASQRSPGSHCLLLCRAPPPPPLASQVKRMISVVEKGSDDRNLIAGFKSQLGELTKLASEARDNVKFLTTLERHFKNISSGPLGGILDTLPPMMNALRMVRPEGRRGWRGVEAGEGGAACFVSLAGGVQVVVVGALGLRSLAHVALTHSTSPPPLGPAHAGVDHQPPLL
jgi:hypothetical protein